MARRIFTKRRIKDNNRIAAWVKQEPFKENARAKPAIPVLTTTQVLSEYTPTEALALGQFFTPTDMGYDAFKRTGLEVHTDAKVLDPCAGIGHLIDPLFEVTDEYCYIDAVEMSLVCAELGAKLFPEARWFNADAFEMASLVEGRYDYVVMNPPYNITCGQWSAEQKVGKLCTRSHHRFLWLAIQALKPGGQLIAIAPYNFISGLPKRMRAWFDEHASLYWETGSTLKGQFALTNIQVHAFDIRKR